jgi:hypothetical protein
MKIESDEKLDDWFADQITKIVEFGGEGSQTEVFDFYNCNTDYWGLNIDNIVGFRGIDLVDSIESAMNFGNQLKTKNFKIFKFIDGTFIFYFLAKNKTELKKLINSAITIWMEECEPLPPPPKSLSQKINELVDEMAKDGVDEQLILKVKNLLKNHS